MKDEDRYYSHLTYGTIVTGRKTIKKLLNYLLGDSCVVWS